VPKGASSLPTTPVSAPTTPALAAAATTLESAFLSAMLTRESQSGALTAAPVWYARIKADLSPVGIAFAAAHPATGPPAHVPAAPASSISGNSLNAVEALESARSHHFESLGSTSMSGSLPRSARPTHEA